jgi:Pregnancy-associated plasma protein-A
VVVHIVHNDESSIIGNKNSSNISFDQIKSQIDILNEDYRRKPNTMGFNSNPIGADMNIEFYLADIDPNGKPTNGINRVFDKQSSFDPFDEADQLKISKLSYWPSDCYFNIWTTTLSNNYLGYSQFPSANGIDGLGEEVDEKLDGVYIDYRYFGRKSSPITSKYYKLGRTTTHEVGHWLGLIHTWGDENCGDDYVKDTPAAENSNLTLVCADKYSTCSGSRTKNMIENYMDYTIDSCMNTFTIGQRERVNIVFELSTRRKKLIECSTRLPESDNIKLEIVPNPIVGDLKGKLLFKGNTKAEILLFDRRGNLLERQIFLDRKSFLFTIPFNNLPKGIYIVKAIANGQSTSQRILN